MKRFLFSLITFFAVGVPFLMAGDPCEVQVVTAEDYGLELDWALPLKSIAGNYGVSVVSIKHDKEGNVYCGGHYKKNLSLYDKELLSKSNERICVFIAKFTEDGDLLWCKDFYSQTDKHCTLQSICGIRENAGELCLALSFDGEDAYYYDNHYMKDLKEGEWASALLNVSVEDGSLKRFFLMPSNDGVRTLSFYRNVVMMGNGDYVLGGYIDTTFVGMNGRESSCRSRKNSSRYIVKLDSLFNVKWDYAYDTELSNEGLTCVRTDGELFSVGDTLYNLFHYEVKEFNVNPEDTPIIVNRAFGERVGSVILKCDISGNSPKLMGYWHDGGGTLSCDMQKNLNGKIYGSLALDFNTAVACVELDANMKMDEVVELPFQRTNNWWGVALPAYSFGEDGRICVLGCEFGREGLIYKFAEEMDSVRFKSDFMNYMLSIYGADNKFHSAITTDYVYLKTRDLDDRRGCFYLGANNEYNTMSTLQIPIDWDPDPNNQVCNDASKLYVDVVKYTETFRIKPKVAGNGRIVLQDSFVRFGGSTVIEVIPAAGSRIDSVVTSRGEILTSENGLFKIENVTDVVGVTAYFSNSTGVETYETDKIRISPNPTTGEIRVKGKENFDYEILDMQGKTQLQGHSEDGVLNVGGLPDGEYMLKIENYISIFYKK